MKELLNLTDHHYKAFQYKLLRILSANIATVLCGLHEVCQKGQFNLEGISIVCLYTSTWVEQTMDGL